MAPIAQTLSVDLVEWCFEIVYADKYAPAGNRFSQKFTTNNQAYADKFTPSFKLDSINDPQPAESAPAVGSQKLSIDCVIWGFEGVYADKYAPSGARFQNKYASITPAYVSKYVDC